MPKAIGMVEFNSMARGIFSADKMVKVSAVDIVTCSPTCPGKYIAIVHGDVSAVEDSVKMGEQTADEYLVDSIVIPNVHQDVFPAITGTTMPDKIGAVGIIESFSIATMIIVADAVLKAANVEPIELRLGNGLGGKALFVFTGDLSSVESGIKAGQNIAIDKSLLVNSEIIASPSNLLVSNLL